MKKHGVSVGCGVLLFALVPTLFVQALELTGIPGNVSLTCGATIPSATVGVQNACSGSIPTDSLVLHFGFDASNAVTTADLSGAGNTGTNKGCTWVSSGHSGGAMSFDGNDYIALGRLPQANNATGLSFGAWIKPGMLGTMGIIGKTLSGNENIALHLGGTGNSNLYANVMHGGVFTVLGGTMGITTSSWQHVMCVFGGTQVMLYVNGQVAGVSTSFAASVTRSNAVEAAVGDTAVGRGWYFKGLIDDVRVYNRALESQEVQALATGGVTLNLTVQTNGNCPRVVTRTWTATDPCGGYASATQQITYLDIDPPVFSGVPASTTWACGTALPPPPTVTALDACSGPTTVQFAETTPVGCPDVVLRTWSAVDACGNSSVATQRLELTPASPPALLGVPADQTVDCNAIPPPPLVLATGMCFGSVSSDQLVLHYSFNASNALTVLDESGSGNTGTNKGSTWVAGGRSGGGMSFDGNDWIALGRLPQIDHATSLTFGAWIKPSSLGTAGILGRTLSGSESIALHLGVTDKLVANVYRGTNFTILYTNRAVSTGAWQHVMCVFNGTQVRLFQDGQLIATSTVETAATIHSNSALAAIGDTAVGRGWYFRGLMDEVRVYRRALADSEVQALAQGMDGATPATLAETTTGICPRVLTRQWSATDSCGGQASATQRITLVDSVAPSLTGVPGDITLACGTLAPIPTVTASDGCDGAVPVFFAESSPTGCPAESVRTWSAIDACGNGIIATQHIHWVPLTPPTLVGIPSNIEVSCDAIPAPPAVTATGVCAAGVSDGGLVLHYTFDGSNSVTITDESGWQNTGTNRGATWVADGWQGGAMSFDGNDIIALGRFPQVNGAAALTFGAWIKPTSLGTMGIIGKTANLDETAALHIGAGDKLVANLDHDGTFTVLYTNRPVATGAWQHVMCVFDGRQTLLYLNGDLIATSSVHALSSVSSNNVEAAIGDMAVGRGWFFRGLIDDVRVYRRALTPAEVGTLASQAGTSLPVYLAESVSGSCPRVLTRTWTAMDACGQQTTATQQLTLIDVLAPVLSGVPSDRSLTCGQVPPSPPLVTAHDGCMGPVAVQFSETATTGCPSRLTRVWTAMDGCGNLASATQNIHFTPPQPLTLAGVPADTTVTCTAVPAAPAVLALGGCTGAVSDTGLILWYPFDSLSTNIIVDASAGGNTGTNHGAAWVAGGHAGGAMSFTGASSIDLGRLPQINGASQLTFGAWIKPSTLGTLGILGKTISGNETIALHVGAGDKLVANVDRDGAFTVVISTQSLRTNEWQHVLCVYDGQQVLLYIDGQPAGASSVFAPARISSNSVAAAVGDVAAGRGWYFRGLIDDVRVYDRALNAGEVASLAEAGGALIPVHLAETWSGTCPRILTRVWSATDGCGQSVIASQRVEVADNQAPVLAGVPADVVIACGSPVPLPPVVTAIDACDNNVSISLQSSTNGTCPSTISRTWTATDNCGNSTSATSHVYLQTPAAPGDLVLRYGFDAKGDVIPDTSGNGYDAVAVDTKWSSRGLCGGALRFDDDARAEAANVLDLGSGRTAITVFASIRLNGYPEGEDDRERVVIAKAGSRIPLNGWTLALDANGRPLARLVGDYPEIAQAGGPNTISDGAWHVLAAQFEVSSDAMTTRLYVDGFLEAATTRTGTHAGVASPAPLVTGNLGPDYASSLEGLIDEIRVYGRALTAHEVEATTLALNDCQMASASLRVLIEPAAARTAGAQWRVLGETNTTWNESGDEISVAAGLRQIEFGPATGWTPPATLTIAAPVGDLTVVTGRYTAVVADTNPPLIVLISPPSGSVALDHSMVMNIKAIDDTGIALITVNGQAATWKGGDNYQITLEGLRGLFNKFEVTVRDLSGNATSTNVTYRQAGDLKLRALWNGMWEVDNPFQEDVPCQWVATGVGSGSMTALAETKTRFSTPAGSYVLNLYVGQDLVASRHTSAHPGPAPGEDEESIDSDLDGISNHDEDLAGTDADDAASVLDLKGSSAGKSGNLPAAVNGLQALETGDQATPAATSFNFMSSADHEYTLQYSPDLRTWQTVLDFQHVSGTGGWLSYTNRFQDPVIHFRIKAAKKP